MNFYNNSIFYKKSYEEALKNNENTVIKITNFKKELEGLRSNVKENQKHLYQNIMVPFGNKAMMRGKLMHTNEVYVNVGDRWFIKTSAKKASQICERMVERCNQNLHEFKKETKLLSSNLTIPDKIGIFPNDDVKDIIEPYDEQSEVLWKKKHRKRVQEYKKRDAEKRLSDKQLFDKLNQLDDAEEDERKQHYDNNLNENEKILKFTNEFLQASSVPKLINSPSVAEKKIEKQILFPERDAYKHNLCNIFENMDENCMIHFEHSEKIPQYYDISMDDEISSPYDIYRQFLSQLNLVPILKNRNIKIYEKKEVKETNSYPYQNRLYEKINVIGDIVEKTQSKPEEVITEARPLSKFKSRLQNLRS